MKAMQTRPPAELEERRRELAEAEQSVAKSNGTGAATSEAGSSEAFGGPVTDCSPHPTWYPPVRGEKKGLKVLNSLTGDERGSRLEDFVPLKGNTVKWYTCGPTVYDVCHMGHARAYLTFDILRRIVEDYFRYDVTYHINITDIDDKIILRARRNHLLDNFAKEKGGDFDTVFAAVSEGLKGREAALAKKKAELSEPLPSDTPSMRMKEREEKLAELALKESQFKELKEAVAVEIEGKNAKKLFTVARDVLGEYLDGLHGSEVTDHDIFNAHARAFEVSYFEDMEALGVKPPDILTRVTEYVPEIVAYIAKIIENKCAYAANGSVYLDLQELKKQGHNYRKLRPGADTSKAEMEEGEGALAGEGTEKKHPNDFALWKASKAGEPEWDSPWGKGRPGWHIECSVVASDTFGCNMDVHAGGSDLKFPHHDNELAQSEAHYCNHQWVNYFFHAGHLKIKGLKMSKSLKNFITIRQALEKYTAREMRMMFLLAPWYREMNFSDLTMDDAKSKDKTFREFFGAAKAVLRSNWLGRAVGFHEPDRELHKELVETQGKVHNAFCDNFDTRTAMLALLDLVSKTNTYLAGHQGKECYCTIRKVSHYITSILKVVGIASGADDIGYTDSAAGGDRESVVGPVLDAMRDFRDDVRSAARRKDESSVFLKLCDAVRDKQMPPLGVRFEDPVQGEVSRWKLESPEVLMREIEEKEANVRKMAEEKAQKKAEAEANKAKKAAAKEAKEAAKAAKEAAKEAAKAAKEAGAQA